MMRPSVSRPPTAGRAIAPGEERALREREEPVLDLMVSR